MKLIIIAIIFILGLLFCCNYKHSDFKEGFQSSSECPNLLVQKGKELHLIYSNKARIPGVNPIKFKNLDLSFRGYYIHAPLYNVTLLEESYIIHSHQAKPLILQCHRKTSAKPTE